MSQPLDPQPPEYHVWQLFVHFDTSSEEGLRKMNMPLPDRDAAYAQGGAMSDLTPQQSFDDAWQRAVRDDKQKARANPAPRLSRAEVEWFRESGEGEHIYTALSYRDVRRLAQDALAYLDALASIVNGRGVPDDKLALPLGEFHKWFTGYLQGLARAVLPAEEARA